MDRTKVSIAVLSIVIVSIVTAATARSSTSNTPLYTVRMEQASSKMNFLPTETNKFSYTTEEGHILDCDVAGGCCTAESFTAITCEPEPSCWETCWSSCKPSCWETCSTCFYTCPWTCGETSCLITCPPCDDTSFTCAPLC